MKRQVTFKGQPLTLIGQSIEVGQRIANIKATAQDLSDHTLGQHRGKTIVLTTFPSLDTPVCEIQLKTFNRQATQLSDDVVVIAVSMDLPFAQSRFCSIFNTNDVVTLSDYKYQEIGLNLGIMIKELKLLTRSALIIDKNSTLQYIQIADEITSALDYDDIFEKLKAITEIPVSKDLPNDACQSCESQKGAMDQTHIREHLASLDNWSLENGLKITKTLDFGSFPEAVDYLHLFAQISETMNHHPVFELSYNKLTISLWTHSVSGLTENDFILAKKFDRSYSVATHPASAA
jgi:thiol peroxidase